MSVDTYLNHAETACELEAKLRSAFDYAAIGMALVGLDGSWIQVNSAICKIVGYAESELLGSTFQAITHPADLTADLAHAQQLLDNQIQTYQIEKRYIHKQGHEIWVLLSVSLLRGQNEQPICFFSQIQDISQQKQHELALKRSQQENQLLLEAISDVVLVRDAEGRCLKILSSQPDTLYRPASEMLGKTLHDIMPLDEANVIFNYIQLALARQRPIRGEYSLQLAARKAHFSATFSPISSNKVLISTHDITNRKRMENSFRMQSMIIENMAQGVCLLRKKDNTIVYANPKFDQMFGYELGELVGRNVSILNYGNADVSEGVTNRIIEQINPQGKFAYEVHNVKKDGTPFWCRGVTSVFEHAEHGTVFVAVQTDITEEKQAKLEIELLQELTLAIGAAENLETALGVLLQKVCETYGWIYGEAWIPCPKQQRLRCGPVYTLPEQTELDQFKQFSKICTFAPNVGLPGRVWSSQSPEWLIDVSQESQHCFQRQPQALECGIRAGLGVPIVFNSKVLAVLVFFKREAAHPDQCLLKSLSTIAAQLNLVMLRKQIEDSLFHEKELAQITLHSIGDGVITTDAEGRVQYLNPVALDVTGWSQAEAQGRSLTEILHIFHEVTREPLDNPVMKALQENRVVELENDAVLLNSHGIEIPIEDSAAPIRSQQGEILGTVMVFRDVTKSRSLSKQLNWQAQHDPLTQLVNRREFEKCLETAVQATQFQSQFHVLCYLDLDRFKIVNDTCGHEAGDELLQQVTTLFKLNIRKSDTLARLGGDEFALLLHQCPIEPALRLVNQLQEQVQQFRFTWEEKSFSLGVSIGIVAIDSNSCLNAKTLLNQADAACYEAKRRGGNRFYLYQADDEELSQQQKQLQWVNYLTKALEEDRFCLYSQPIISVVDSEVKAERYEILLRLKDEAENLIAPTAFLASAERYNLMHLIDRWVIRTTFATQGAYYRRLWSSLQAGEEENYLYTINLSGASINDDQFVDFVKHQFELHQIPPQLICFEVTETVAIANLSKAAQFMIELKELGCRFALDDFGSGMSSFGYLKKLPVDFIKIDGSFIKEMVNDSFDSAVVEAIHRVCQVVGLKTIAEFVESTDILNQLKRLGIDYAQGYGIAPPHFLTWA